MGRSGERQDVATRNGRRSGIVYVQLALGMIVFGSATPVSKLVTEAMPVFVGSTFRVFLGALVLAPFAWSAREAVTRFERRDWLLVCLIALVGMFGFTVAMLYGMRMITGVAGSIVMASTPAVTAAGAMLIFGESANWRKLTAIALAVAGIVLLHAGGSSAGGSGTMASSGGGGGLVSATMLGLLLVFVAVCCEATYTLLGRKMSRDFDPRLIAFAAAAISLPLFVPFAAWQWQDFQPSQVGASGWMATVWYGAGTLALGSLLWYSGIARTQGSIAAGFMALMPVSALVLSYVLLGEAFRPIHLAGFATVFIGVLIMSWEHARAAAGRS
ncbi:MAG: DMT family transporter [Rhizobiaceae bacterium]|nr:DMT family transporter [Rhizobiaceae bacterium]MCV0404983.1 DMT family transporter [Rhizobiaceae bacterium]